MIESGNTSNAFKITTGYDKWILRSLKNEVQGIIELKVSKDIHKQIPDIVAEIIYTKNNEPFVWHGGRLYNLQKYMEGHKVTPNLDCHFQIGESIGRVHKFLEVCDCRHNQTDRFDIERLWGKVKHKWQNLYNYSPELVPDTDKMNSIINDFINHTSVKSNLIHGDLGVWNMLIKQQKVKIIDFGEARLGNFYFDLSAGITTAIREDSNDVEIKYKLSRILNGYEKV